MQDLWIDDAIHALLVSEDKTAAANALYDEVARRGREGFAELIRSSRICHPYFRSESFDRLYCSLRNALQGDVEWRYGPNRIASLQKTFGRVKDLRPLQGAALLELGCGPQHPLGLTALYYLNGAARTIASDVEGVLWEERSAIALLDLIMQCLAFPAEWNFSGADEGEFVKRARRFDLAALRGGKLAEGIAATPCEYRAGDTREVLRNCAGALDIIISNAVLEHVNPLEEFAALFAQALRPGGVMCHVVDFIDHRWYVGKAPHRFYYMEQESGPDLFNVNQLRCSQVEAIFKAAGFTLAFIDRGEKELPEGLMHRLKPEYAALPESDIRTTYALMAYRRG